MEGWEPGEPTISISTKSQVSSSHCNAVHCQLGAIKTLARFGGPRGSDDPVGPIDSVDPTGSAVACHPCWPCKSFLSKRSNSQGSEKYFLSGKGTFQKQNCLQIC